LCYGNIMRSAFAEACFRQAAPDIACASAGVAAFDDNRAEPHARAMAQRFGVSLESHRAQRLRAHHVGVATHIYFMDSLNEELLLRHFPQAAAKSHYLGSLLAQGPREIEDPYLQGDKNLEHCFFRIQMAVAELLAQLRHSRTI
jgi:protein-tyrosine phosphatase